MEAKEKAKELKAMMLVKINDRIPKELRKSEFIYDAAKACAIICVDEILLYYPVATDDERSKRFNEFWQQVKEEIKTL